MNPHIGKLARIGGLAAWKGVSKAKRRQRGFELATRRWALYRARKELDIRNAREYKGSHD